MNLIDLYKRSNLMWKVSTPLILIIIVGMVFQANIISKLLTKNTLDSTVQAAKSVIEQYKLLRSYYSENIVSKVKKSGVISVDFTHKSTDNQIPLPATMILDLSEILNANNVGTKVKLYSSDPFPNRSGRVLDDFQKDAIAYFKTNPDGVFVREDEKSVPRRMRVAIPDKMVAQSCVDCHNGRSDSPYRSWKLGDVRGVLEVETNIEDVLKANSRVMATTWGLTSFTGALILIILLIVLRYIIVPIKRTTQELSNAANDIFEISEALSGTSNELTDSASRQAANFTETSTALSTVSKMVEGNTQFTNEANESSQNLLNLSKGAQSSMNELSSAMNDILDANQKIDNLVKIIEEIGTKTEIIDDIVFKTQLLSFNASVEAERAGEHGRGFAVVAQEVGNLAQVSGAAAAEIAQIVKSSIRDSAEVAEYNRTRVKKGDELASSSRDQLNVVLSRVQNIIDALNEIASASREQTTQVGQIAEAISQLSHIAEQTSKNAEITSISSSSLSDKSKVLLNMISQLENVMNGAIDSNSSRSNFKRTS